MKIVKPHDILNVHNSDGGTRVVRFSSESEKFD